MPRSIPNEMPTTLAGWNELCENTRFNQQEAYDQACEQARHNAAAQWDADAPAKRTELVKQIKSAIAAQIDSEGKQLTEAEQQAMLAEAEKQIDAELARQREDIIANAIAGIEPPQTLEQIQNTFACYRPQEESAMPEPQPAAPNLAHAIYQVGDRFYDVAEGAWLAAQPQDKDRVIRLGGEPTEANLRENLEYFKLPVGDCLLTPEELVKRRRDSIDADTSAKILGGFDYAVNGETLHFSYDSFDQQNFADTANACLMRKAGAEGLPETITWNAYRHDSGELVRLTLTSDQFLELYARGALNHKATCMELGGVKKAQISDEVAA